MAKEIVSIGQLEPGMVIVAVAAQNGPVKIRKSGLVTSKEMVQGLAEMGVLELEVDPEQKVEIAGVEIPKSQTQKLLDSSHQQSSHVDHTLADQFNRSLFLPSVQAVPSVWRHHATSAMLSALMVVGGVAIGWSAATYQSWWPELDTRHVANQHAVTNQLEQTAPADLSEPEQPMGDGQATSSTASATVQINQPQAPQQAEKPVEVEERVLGYIPESASDNSEQTDLNNVSQDLLEKFRQAVADLDAQPTPQSAPVEQASTDVPDVQQLPSGLIAQLPSMAFSVHMYSAQPQDRWVRVNGEKRFEGNYIDNQVRIERIEAQHVILSFKGETFSMGALTDW